MGHERACGQWQRRMLGKAYEQENMDRKLRNRILIFLVLAGSVAYVLVWLSGREPVAKIAAVMPSAKTWLLRFPATAKWSRFRRM